MMAWVQKYVAVAARERMTLAVRLEGVEPVPGEAVVVGWGVATVVREVRPRRAAEAGFAADVVPAQAGGEAESGNLVRQTKRAVL